MQVVMGGTWGFKALLPLGAELCLQAMLLARKFKRCGKKMGGGGVYFKKKKKAFLRLHSLVTRMLSWMWQSAPGEARSAKRQ